MTLDDLEKVFEEILASARATGMVPIIHLEAHGGPDGIQLRDATIVPWKIVGKMLRSINLETRFNLIVALACCDGIHAIMGLEVDQPSPFAGLIGCEGKIETTELFEGYDGFYRTILNGGSLQAGLSKLKESTNESIGTRHVFYPCERAFIMVLGTAIRQDQDPDYLKEQRKHYKRTWDRFKALNGNLVPTSDKEVDALLGPTWVSTVKEFHSRFFAINEVPGNSQLYDFELLTAAARENLRRQDS